MEPITGIIPVAPPVTNFKPIGRGRVVGWDAGGPRKFLRIGRNEDCPCGSGMKFKKCCLPVGRKFRVDG